MTFKKIDDLGRYGQQVYGVVETDRSLFINLQKLWNESKNEKIFIDNFSKVYIHEVLHKEIARLIAELYNEREEEIVDLMANSANLNVRSPSLFWKDD